MDWTTGVRLPAGQGFLTVFTTESKPVLLPTQPFIAWQPAALSPGVKQPRREAYHSPQSAEVKNLWICTSTSPVGLHGVVVKHRGNFTFLLLPFTKGKGKNYVFPVC
jgi:hypothetical protein